MLFLAVGFAGMVIVFVELVVAHSWSTTIDDPPSSNRLGDQPGPALRCAALLLPFPGVSSQTLAAGDLAARPFLVVAWA